MNLHTRYIDPEISQLNFTMRVLAQAKSKRYPLLERVNFLGVSAGNLDEYFMLQIPEIQQNSDEAYLQRILEECRKVSIEQLQTYRVLEKELKHEGIVFLDPKKCTVSEKKAIHTYFQTTLLPFLTPLILDAAHPFPLIPVRNLNLILELVDPQTNLLKFCLIIIPRHLGRFIRIRDDDTSLVKLMAIEDVIACCFHEIYPQQTILGHGVFRILRDGMFITDQESSDFWNEFQAALYRRQWGQVTCLSVDAKMPDSLKLYIAQQFGKKFSDIFVVHGPLGLCDLKELKKIDRQDLKNTPLIPRKPRRLHSFHNNIFHAIALKDLLLHHPFEDFETVLEFFRQASEDPQVIAIKQTIYRTGLNSPLPGFLMQAARNNKLVTAVVEVKADSDEEANMKWAKELEHAGVQVVFGIPGYKIHSKMTLIARQEEEGLKTYAHIGTGNYHPITAQEYVDASLFTSHQGICEDIAKIFNFITGYSSPHALNHVKAAPMNMRQTLLSLIQEEIQHAQQGRPAQIWAKLNGLSDPELVEALYKASQEGVKIRLLVRGVCTLLPGQKFSKNIEVRSIIGRFLEHSRFVIFGNGHELPSREAKVFLTSANWMALNFESRVEVMVPIYNPTVHQQILEQIMSIYLNDQANAWILNKNGVYEALDLHGKGFCAHEYFMSHDSLSGSGLGPYTTDSFVVIS